MKNAETTENRGGQMTKAAARCLDRMKSGEKIMRDSNGRTFWPTGRRVSQKMVNNLIDSGVAKAVDTDIFGDPHYGQVIGVDDDPH